MGSWTKCPGLAKSTNLVISYKIALAVMGYHLSLCPLYENERYGIISLEDIHSAIAEIMVEMTKIYRV